MRRLFLVEQTERSVTAPCSCAIALAIAVLTPVEFTEAARVAEGADRPRLPAAPALHPTLCRPDPTPRSLRCNAAMGRYIIPARGGLRQRLSLFSTAACTHIHTCILEKHTYRATHNDVGSDAAAPSSNSYLLSCIAPLPSVNTHALGVHTFTKLGTFTILLHMLLSVQCRLEKERGRGGRE